MHANLECIAEVQHGSASADKLAAAGEGALDDGKELAAGLEHIGLLGILHGLPALLLHQAVHSLPQLLLLCVHIHPATCTTVTVPYASVGGWGTYTLRHAPASQTQMKMSRGGGQGVYKHPAACTSFTIQMKTRGGGGGGGGGAGAPPGVFSPHVIKVFWGLWL